MTGPEQVSTSMALTDMVGPCASAACPSKNRQISMAAYVTFRVPGFVVISYEVLRCNLLPCETDLPVDGDLAGNTG